MDRSAKQTLKLLGRDGLARVLADVVDQAQLVRLASACGLKYRGMRTQSQTRERLLSDVAQKASKQDVARQAVLRVLQKETATALRDWKALAPEEKARRLSDEAFLLADGNLGVHLLLLASTTESADLGPFAENFAHQYLLRLASSGQAPSDEQTQASREATRVKRKLAELEKKNRHGETQLSKARDLHKSTKRDLIERKGELAESRMLVERLRIELAAAQSAARGGGSSAASERALADLAKALRKMETGQRKLTHQVANFDVTPGPEPAQAEAIEGLVETLGQLRRDLGRQRQEVKKEIATHGERLEELRREIKSISAESPPTRATRRARAKGGSARVGVFIDVQNVYYGARQLKGKLDFDSLMQVAVGERRLIQATAYVVVSKETDQSQFLKMLENRGIRIRRKTLKVRVDGSMKGDWDTEMVLDVLDATPQLDVVTLVSGDGDFTSLVERVKALGPRVEVIAFPRTTAKALIQSADEFRPLDRKSMIQPSRRLKPHSAPAQRTKRERQTADAEPRRSPRAERPQSSTTASGKAAS